MKINPTDPTPGPKKFFDVMRPGRATPSATSRPVIVGHQPQVKDDISGISPRAANSDEQRPLMDTKSRVTVQPTGTLNSPPAAAEPSPPPDMPTVQPTDDVPSQDVGVLSGYPSHAGSARDPYPATPPSEIDLGEMAMGSEAPQPPMQPLEPQPQQVSQQPAHDPVISAAMKDLDTTVGETAAPHTRENIIVSHHKGGFRFGRFLLILLAVAILGAVIMNFLLDFGILNPDSDLPHTDFFDNLDSRVD